MYDSINVDVNLIKKSSNDFSFISTVFDLGVNQDFTSLKLSVLNTDVTNEYTNIWRTLSAIGQEVGDAFQTSILNFLDNISNIDLCDIKSLESMISFFGVYYNVFASILNFPLEILKLIDILSIPREYFYNSKKVTTQLLSAIYKTCSCDNTFLSNAISSSYELTNERNRLLNLDYSEVSLSDYLNHNINNLSNFWHNSTNNTGISVEADNYVDDALLNNFMSSVYFNFLRSQLDATYNDISCTKIYTLLSTSILSGYTFSIGSGNTNAETMRIQFNISKSFNLDNAVDAYLYGLSTENNFSENEMTMILTEISCRAKPFEKTPLDNATRYKYYREVKFKEYYDFVENQNINYNKLFSNASLYMLDNSYFEISSNVDASDDYSKNRLLSASDDGLNAVLDNNYIMSVTTTLVEITNAIRDIRHLLKMQCLKNFMKGTYALLYYVINEYLRNNIVKTIIKIRNSKPGEHTSFTMLFDQSKNKNEVLTYIDPIDYFNISCEGDISIDVNPRYWQQRTNIQAIGAIDNTNILKSPDTIEYNNTAFAEKEITDFYYDVLKNKFNDIALCIPTLSNYNDALYDFLDAIFSIGADATKLDKDGNIKTVDGIDDNFKEYKEKLFNYYTGISSGYAPYYYFTNEVHPSYQIHSYLSGFIENTTYSYPIKNLTTTAVEDVISDLKKRIDKYLDNHGYLINEWRNPLASNADYLTKYERSSHINDKNYIDPVVDYDGLFYPYAVIQCISDMYEVRHAISSNSISCNFDEDKLTSNYYYGLQFNSYNKKKVINLLSIFKLLIKAEATSSSPHCIYKYALDIFGNAYILLKNCRSTDSEEDQKNADGILWIRYRNNPIAFPAYVKTNEYANDNEIALLKMDKSTTNNYIISAEVISFDFRSSETAYSELSTYNILDFYMTNDKKHVIVNIIQKVNGKRVVVPCISIIDKEYDVAKDYVQFSFDSMRNKIGPVDTICDMSINDLSTYTFDKFFTRDTLIGAIYHKIVENNVLMYLPYSDIATTTIAQDNISATIPLKFAMKSGTNLAVDTDANNNINIAYITTANKKSSAINATNFISSTIRYNDISSHIRYSFNNDMIVTLTAYYGNLNRAVEVELEKNDSTEKNALFYNTYTDNGFFGLISSAAEEKNSLDNSILTYDYYDDAISSSELVTRGNLKFLLLSGKKATGMDFKFVLPVRMFEAFANDDKNKHLDKSNNLASYFDLHFGADITDYADKISSDSNITDPKIILALFEDKIPSIRIQEQYFNYVNRDDARRLYNDSATYPYLWYAKETDIPHKYFNPGKSDSGQQGDRDDVAIQVFPKTLPISVSWCKVGDDIQLDFNTQYYKSFAGNNYFNEKRLFLCLEKAGQAGYLNTYSNIDKINRADSSVDPECDVSYYIKNISDEYPKFLLSATTDVRGSKITYCRLFDDDGTMLVTDESTTDTRYSIIF